MKSLVTKEFNHINRQYQNVKDKIANTQRERDLKVDRIDKKYAAKIQILINKLDELALIIKDSKEYFRTH